MSMMQDRPDRGGSGEGGRDRGFRNRIDAGRVVAGLLGHESGNDPIVLALPRGGVPVAYEIARALRAPLDVFLVRKLGAPGQRELGIGAIAQGGVRMLNEAAIALLNVPKNEIERITEEETAELNRRLRRYRGDRPLPNVRGRTVILVDDGLATGISAAAAVHALRRLEPARIVLAVPVCAAETVEMLRPDVDEIVCAIAPVDFLAVGYWYQTFAQTSDDEVVELIERARREYDGAEQPATAVNSTGRS
jgi:putative phosphoribosyl transferase